MQEAMKKGPGKGPFFWTTRAVGVESPGQTQAAGPISRFLDRLQIYVYARIDVILIIPH